MQSASVIQQFSPRSLLPLRQQSLWKLEVGVVRTITWLDDDTIATTGIWGPGDIVGKALSKVEPYQIECLTKVEVSLLPLSRLLEETEALISHLHQSEAFSLIRSYRKIDAMVLKLLSWLAKKFGREVETGHLIDLRLTHQDIAEMLGTTRVTITRTLSQFEQQGVDSSLTAASHCAERRRPLALRNLGDRVRVAALLIEPIDLSKSERLFAR